MADIPRTKFNSPWTVANIEAALNDVSSAKGSSESLTAALNAMRAEINSLSGGVHLKGAVDYYSDLPANPSEGDAYTVRYQGTSGTDPLGIEYAWATYQGTPQWIPIGVDPSVFAKQTEMDVVANAGAKNLLYYNNLPNTNNGVTFTPSETTGIISISGTVTSGSTTATITPNDNLILPAGTYTFTCEDAKTVNTADAYVQKYQDGSPDPTTIARSYENNTFTLTEQSRLRVRCRVYAGKESGQTFSPMIRPAEITDPTFQPYAKTNRELTVLTDEDRTALAELVDGGAKNLLKLGFTHKSAGYQTADMTTDGIGIIVNGDRNTTTDMILVYDLVTNKSDMLDTRYTLPAGKYVIPSTGTSNLRYQVYCHDGTNYQSLGYTMSDPLEFEYTAALKTQYPYIAYRLWASRVSSFDNYTFYPMVCAKSAWKISKTYQPYRPSWQEMWDAIQALQNGGNRALTMPTEPEEQEER